MSRLEEIKKKYVGKWIALKDSEVIATSMDYHELHENLKKRHIKGAIEVIHSPKPNEEEYETLL